MFTPGRAGGQGVLVWEGSVAAPASPLAWHSATPVEVFFHTGHHDSTRVLAPEFTRQLDRQLSALSLLSAERLLEGIRAYRTQGRQPTSTSTRKDKKLFMEQVVDDLQRTYGFSDSLAETRAAEVDRALVVLHESDQVTYGPSQPATTAGGWPSLGVDRVNSSIGGQGRPVATVLEQAALQVPPEQRSRVRLLVRAVLTSSPALAHQLRHGQAVLEPRTQAQVSATSPRGPPWIPAHVAATLATGHTPWNTPPPAQDQPDRAGPATGQPGSTRTGTATAGPPQTGATRQPGPTHTGATTAGPPQTGQPDHKITREEVLARITTQARAAREAPAGADPARLASLREASFSHPPTAAVRTPPVREGAPPPTGGPGQPSRPGQPGHKITPEEVLADIEARIAQRTQQPTQPRTPRQTPTRNRKRNRGLGR